MLSIRTFGGLSISRDGIPLPVVAGRRKPLALLALLAVSGRRGMSRDRVMAYLWPESTTDQARSVLRQTIYNLRRDLGDLLEGGTELRLNAAVVTSDIAAFEEALARGDVEAAVATYDGPLLDGFHLNDAPEFEQWVETERQRVAQRVQSALEGLASNAELRGDLASAVVWWRRLAVLDPHNSRFAVGLMRVLAAAGDPAGALRHGRLHESRMLDDVGSAPDASVIELAQRIRTQLPAAQPAGEGDWSRQSQRVPDVPFTAAIESSTHARESASQPRRAATRRVATLFFAILGLTVVLGLIIRYTTDAPSTRVDGTVAITPFRLSTDDSTLAFLPRAVGSLLATSLSRDAALQPIDPTALEQAWESAGLIAGAGWRDASRIARRLGASQMLTGTITGVAERVLVTAELRAVRDRSLIAHANVDAPADSAAGLVERLSALLLLSAAGETEDRVATLTRTDPGALRSYLAGQIKYRRGQYWDASEHFRAALQQDSTLALAGLRLALSNGWAGRPQAEHDWALRLAWRARAGLTPRDAAFLTAFAAGRIPEARLPSGTAFMQAWDRALELIPDWPEVWFEYGDRFFHVSPDQETPDPHTRAAAAFRRALTLDSAFAPAIPHMLQLEAIAGNRAAVQRLARIYRTVDSTSGAAHYVRWRAAIAVADSTALRDLRAQFDSLPVTTLRWIILAGLFDQASPHDATAAANAWTRRAVSEQEQFEAHSFAHAVALNRGRADDVASAIAAIGRLHIASTFHVRLPVLDALYGGGDNMAAAVAAGRLLQSARAPIRRGTARLEQLRDICVLAQWTIKTGGHAAVPRFLELLRNPGVPNDSVPERAFSEIVFCRRLLEAQLATVTLATHAKPTVAQFDEAVRDAHSPGETLPYLMLAAGRLHLQHGDYERALQAFRARMYFSFIPTYLSSFVLEEAATAARLGDRAGAIRAAQHYLALRSHADAQWRPEVGRARALLRSLEESHRSGSASRDPSGKRAQGRLGSTDPMDNY